MSSGGALDEIGEPRQGDGDLAIVLGGGSARGAYQAGVLRHIARLYPYLDVPILAGVSAGAINATFLANEQGNFEERVLRLGELWASLDVDDIFRVDTFSLGKSVLRWILQLGVIGGRRGVPNVRGLVDTRPLDKFLLQAYGAADGTLPNEERGRLRGIPANIASGALAAVAVTTTNYRNGETITFYEGHNVEDWDRPMRRSVEAELGIKHVMASAALPIFFPSIRIGDSYYGDGGVRLHAPLAPATHLGANRILAISTRHLSPYGKELANVDATYPPPAQILGVLYNAIFLDNLDEDARQMERINALVAKAGEGAGEVRRVALQVLRPTQDLGVVAKDFEPKLPRVFRFLTRRLGTREQRSQSLISMLMFQKDYISRLMELGEADARAQEHEIRQLIEGN